jgi:hypothetical protein
MKIVAAFCIAACFQTAVLAQRRVEFQFGVRAGVPMTKPLSRVTASCCGIFTDTFPRTLIVGPGVGAVIRDRVQVEFDALYRPLRRLSTESSALNSANSSVTRLRGALWEFPLVIDYRFFRGVVRPYGGGGVVLVTSQSGTSENRYTTTTGMELSNSLDFSRRNWFPAYVINAGLEWNKHRLAIRPEVRYSHGYQDPFFPSRQRNQFECFIGFVFRGLVE